MILFTAFLNPRIIKLAQLWIFTSDMFPHISLRIALQEWAVSVCTLVQTTTTGMPRLCVRALSPKGSSTLSSSSLLLCGVPSSPLPGSVYSWNCFTTTHTQTTITYANNQQTCIKTWQGGYIFKTCSFIILLTGHPKTNSFGGLWSNVQVFI